MDFKQIHNALVLLQQETEKLYDIIQQNILNIFKKDYVYGRTTTIVPHLKNRKLWINIHVAVDIDKYNVDDFLKHSYKFIDSLRDLFSDIEYFFNESNINSVYGRLEISLEIYIPDYNKV